MRRLSRTILTLLLLPFLARAPAAVAEPVASLVTVGPGDAVWEKFGHNMIRLQDDERGFDVCYNWGLFDFDQPNFIFNFIQGRMLYTMAALRTQPLLDEYKAQDRRVTFQRLNLSPQQLNELIVRCEINRQPGNADYRYDYFKDNCSTRVRDIIDGVVGGAIANATKDRPTRPPVTYRQEALRLTQGDFWISLGMDFALGPNSDKPLDLWAEGFLPASVSQSAAFLAEAPVEAWPVKRAAEPAAPPVRWPWLMLAGLGGAGAMVAVHRWRAWAGRTLVRAWWALAGGGGAFMGYIWLFTDHAAGHANQNLWQFSPLALVALATTLPRFRRVTFWLASTIVALSVVGGIFWSVGKLGGPFAQPNGGFILLALPLHLTAAWVARGTLTKPHTADEVAGL
ncbi:MAG TPA: DUF4105 domain-containing protein [Tepidisphaeraceae bacterium]